MSSVPRPDRRRDPPATSPTERQGCSRPAGTLKPRGMLIAFLVRTYARYVEQHRSIFRFVFVFLWLLIGMLVFRLDLQDCGEAALEEFFTLNMTADDPLANAEHVARTDFSGCEPHSWKLGLSCGCYERMTFSDSMYLTVVTISTVGYGDISPQSTAARCFALVYILVGTSYVFLQLSQIFGHLLEAYRQGVLAIIDRFDRTAKYVGEDLNGDERTELQEQIENAKAIVQKHQDARTAAMKEAVELLDGDGDAPSDPP